MSYCLIGRINRKAQELEDYACINLAEEFPGLDFFGGDYINTFAAMDIRHNAVFQKIVAFYAEGAEIVLFGWSNREFAIVHGPEVFILSEVGGIRPEGQYLVECLKRTYRFFM